MCNHNATYNHHHSLVTDHGVRNIPNQFERVMRKLVPTAIAVTVLLSSVVQAETYCTQGPEGQMFCTYANSTRPLSYDQPNPYAGEVLRHGAQTITNGAGLAGDGLQMYRGRQAPLAGYHAYGVQEHALQAIDAWRNYRQFIPSPDWPGRDYYPRW